jgi:protein-S-isoprenylcysteine O-methyltransferase Ste14
LTGDPSARRSLARKAVRIGVTAFLALSAMFFIPAGTLAYWQAWLYMGTLLVPMLFVVRYMLRHSPDLLERRFRFRERERTQIGVQTCGTFFLLAAFIIPGLDHRWGWSSVPVWCVIAADLLVLLGYLLIIRVFKENEYASRTVEVVEGQRVISSGPYAILRHPMYAGVVIFYLASPVALGSWWALLPAAIIVPMLVIRIVNEEQVLQRDLPGYTEYRQRVRYRLVPGIW